MNRLLAPVRSALRQAGGFLGGVVIVALAAWAAPQLGARDGGFLPMGAISWAAVFLIFLIQGLQLPAAQLRAGLLFWRAHLFVLAWLFLYAPAMALLVIGLCGDALGTAQRVGLLFLGILPTTIVMNAAFTAKAGGNGAVSIFNIVLSNLLGVLFVPPLMAWLLAAKAGVTVDIFPLLGAMFLQMILPFLLGQQLRRWWSTAAAQQNDALLKRALNLLILIIIYGAVCDLLVSQSGGWIWSEQLGVIALALALMGLSKLLCWHLLQRFGWAREIRIAAFFAATHKTLAAGLPMLGAVYIALENQAPLPAMALVLVPLVAYHLGQLLVGAFIVGKLSEPPLTPR